MPNFLPVHQTEEKEAVPERNKAKKKSSATSSAVKQPVARAVIPEKPAPAPKLSKTAITRRAALHKMLMTKRQEILDEIKGVLGQTLTEDKQRRLESAM